MSALPFEDVHAYNASGHYIVPNEHLGVWVQMLDGLKLDKVASICSSGEVGFFTLLPHVAEELVMLDHSYSSLAVGAIKYLLMKDLGVSATRDLFASGDKERVVSELKRVSSDLPKVLVDPFKRLISDRYESFQYETKSLAREWKATPATCIRSISSKLDKVTFLHGDLTDAKTRGPFDLFYISNALEHTSRDSKRPIPGEVAKAVKSEGYVLACGRFKSTGVHPEGWEIVHHIDLTQDTDNTFGGKIKWEHVLYKLPKEA